MLKHHLRPTLSYPLGIAMGSIISPRLTFITLVLAAAGGCHYEVDFGAGKSFDVENVQDAHGQWPRWRGERVDGVSPETKWNAKWPDEGPKTLWRINVGKGYSAVAVAAGRAYTLGHKDDTETVFCLDGGGRTTWNHSYRAQPVDNLHPGGPGATPTVDGKRVYTLGREGHLFCFDATGGDVVWSKHLQKDFDLKLPEWGFTSSPLVVDDSLVLDAGPVIALDKTTGKLLWKTDPFKAGYGSPVLFQHGGRRLIAVLNNECLLVVNAEDGQQIARHPFKSSYETTSVTPIVHEDTIFISAGYGKGCELLRLADGKLTRVHENKKMRNQFSTSVLWQGHLYGFDGNSSSSRTCSLVCMEHATGKMKWAERGNGCASLMIAGGKLIILSDQGELVTAEAGAEGYKQLARAKLFEDTCWTMPVLAGGRIYCRSSTGELACVDVSR